MPAYTNAKPHWPELFMEIMRNDDILAHYLSLPAAPLFETQAIIERKHDLIREAEKTLAWNHNKGNTA